MKFKIPLLAVIIVAAICLINKDEIKNMFTKENPVICDICENECPCPTQECVCQDACECPDCEAA